MDSENAIVVNHVSKNFHLPHERAGSIKNIFTSMFRKKNKGTDVQHALRDVSFEIKKGEFFGIVGRNGSGKSTMLKMLAGIYQPSKGTVHVEGKLVPFIELGVGFNPELTGRQNVYLNGALLGFSEKEIDEQYNDIVEFAELHEFMDQKLKNYSSGMQVRLAFSMAVRAKADVLLIDEVLAVGDADFQRKCYDYFRGLKKDKKTVIFVSHDMGAIREFCDRAALIEMHELKMIGNTSKVADEYTQLFLNDDGKESSLNKFGHVQRTGTGAVRISDIHFTKAVYNEKDEAVEFSVKINAYKLTSQLTTGFAIKNAAGQFINGSHTWEIQDDLDVKPGEDCEVNWVCPNVYEDGLYTVDIYAYGSNHEVHDSISEAVSFRIKRKHRSGCIVILPVSVKINGIQMKKRQ